MAKAKKKDEYDPDAAQAILDAGWEAWESGMDPAEAAASSVGLRLPHLCHRYLFQSSILPFGRVILTFGPPGSNKSALLYYFYDLFRRAGGKYRHYEVEDKDTPILRLSLTGYDRRAGKVMPCDSMNHFQREVKSGYDTMKSICSKIGKRVPFVSGVDSLTAKMTEEAMATVEKDDGAANRRFADEARSLNDWFKVVTTYVKDWPFLLLAVRHDKVGKDQYGHDQHRAPGGTAPKFYATYEILQQKVKKLKSDKTEGWEGNRIKFSTAKSSLGSDQRAFEAEIAWKPTMRPNAKGDLVPSQDTVWCWHKATVELLFDLQNQGGPFGRAVDEHIGLSKQTGGRWSSSTLGVKADQAMPGSEMGQLIESCPDLLKAMEPLLGIGCGHIFDPRIGYDEQLAHARATVDDYIAAPFNTEEVKPAQEGDDGGE